MQLISSLRMLARILTIITISCFWEMTYLVERKPVTHKIKTIIKHLSHQGIDAGLLGLSCVASVFILGPDWDLGSMRPGQMFGCISSPFMSALSDCSCQGALFRWVVCNTGQVAGIVLPESHLIILFRTSFFLLICFIFQSQLPQIVNNWHNEC